VRPRLRTRACLPQRRVNTRNPNPCGLAIADLAVPIDSIRSGRLKNRG